MEDNDPLIARLRGLGHPALDPVSTARHLTAMAVPARPAGRTLKLKIGGAFLAGLLLGGAGLAGAGALPAPVQGAAQVTLSKVGLSVPAGGRRDNGPECGANANYRNHGQYVRTHTQDPAAAQSRCGKPIQAGGPTAATTTTKAPTTTTTRPTRSTTTTAPTTTTRLTTTTQPGTGHDDGGKSADKTHKPEDNATPEATDAPEAADGSDMSTPPAASHQPKKTAPASGKSTGKGPGPSGD